VSFFDKDENLKSSAFAGHLHEIATQAVAKEMRKVLFEDNGLDTAYFNCEITLSFSELSSDSFQPLRTVTVNKKEIV
jgi:hypothetical protein